MCRVVISSTAGGANWTEILSLLSAVCHACFPELSVLNYNWRNRVANSNHGCWPGENMPLFHWGRKARNRVLPEELSV